MKIANKIALAVALLPLAFACLSGFTKAFGAGTGMPMMKGLKNPTELAALVERALKRDPTGKSLLDSARCKKNGSCATAHDYFHGIRRAHPSVQLGDIAELPRYLRSLVKQPAPKGEWYMSRMLVRGEKQTYDHAGWKRAFFKGEVVWDDPNTGEHILDVDCGNIVAPRPIKSEAPVSPPIKRCVELVFNAPIGGHVRWGIGTLAGRALLADECNAQRQDDGSWVSWYGECDICTPAIGYIRGAIGGTAQVFQKFLYPVMHTKQTLRFSTEIWTNLAYVCLDASGTQSCGVYMRPQDWKDRYRVEIPDALWVWGNCPG
ncbi:MAG: hypothetical protein AAB850_01640 [Patescibacteria group bacterium]